MAMSLSAIVSAIENHVTSGLEGTAQVVNFSHLQLGYEVALERSNTILQASEKNLFKAAEFATRFELPFVSQLTDIDHPFALKGVTLCWIPRPAKVFNEDSIMFLGGKDQETGIRIYFDESFRHHRFSMSTGKRPYAWVDMSTERVTPDKVREVHCWIFNKPASFKKAVMTRMVPEDLPVEEMLYDDNWMFPAPDAIIKQAIQSLSEKYIRYYRNMRFSQDAMAPAYTANQPTSQVDEQ